MGRVIAGIFEARAAWWADGDDLISNDLRLNFGDFRLF